MSKTMSEVEFLRFNDMDSEAFIDILNEDAIRAHLIDHPYFDSSSIQEWMEEKVKTDAMPGCRVRAVSIKGELAGWCGIQPDDDGFELAIVLSQKYWGFGKSIFKTIMIWAEELGHKEVLFHLLDSRRQYQSLRKISNRVLKSELLGRNFTTYYISVTK